MTKLEEIKQALARPFEEARALPFSAYTSPELFELECQNLVQREWLPMCPAGALPDPGDYFAVDIGGEPVMVIRGDDGELRALSNVCRHRGTPLAEEGYGNTRTFVCAFHAWSYDTAGKLLAVPHPGTAKIDKAAHCLPQFKLEVWRNMVFINLDPDAEPLRKAFDLDGLEAVMALYGADQGEMSNEKQKYHDWNSNWKLAAENSIESYHLFQLHRTTIDPTMPTRDTANVAGSPRWTVNAGVLAGDYERKHWILCAIHPFWVVVIQPPPSGESGPDTWAWQAQVPGATPTTCKVNGGSVYLPRTGLEVEVVKEGEEDVYNFFFEDKVQCELQQRAMRAQRTQGGKYVELERILVDLYNHMAWRVFDCEPKKPWRAV